MRNSLSHHLSSFLFSPTIQSFKDHSSASPRCGYNKAATSLAIALILRAQLTSSRTRTKAYQLLETVCHSTEDLFLFHHYYRYVINGYVSTKSGSRPSTEEMDEGVATDDDESGLEMPESSAAKKRKAQQPAKEKRGSASAGMKKFMARWYHRRDPLELATSCTGLTRRYSETHAHLIKVYHVKPATKAMEIVFSCIGVRGGLHPRNKKGLAEMVLHYHETTPAEKLDEKCRKILDYYHHLAMLHFLIRQEKESEDKEEDDEVGEEEKKAVKIARRESRREGPVADQVAAIMKQIKVSVLMDMFFFLLLSFGLLPFSPYHPSLPFSPTFLHLSLSSFLLLTSISFSFLKLIRYL